jgi:hypothetical protein
MNLAALVVITLPSQHRVCGKSRGQGTYGVDQYGIDLFLFEITHEALPLEEGEGASKMDEE